MKMPIRNLSENTPEGKKNFPAVLVALLLVGFAIVGVWFVSAQIAVSGSTSLANGVPVKIRVQGLGFSVSSQGKETNIQARNHSIIFRKNMDVVLDGKTIGVLPPDSKEINLEVMRGSLRIQSTLPDSSTSEQSFTL